MEENKSKVRKMFYEDLPKWGKGFYAAEGSINWNSSIDKYVSFEYEGIYGKVKIIDYKKRNLIISYEDKEPLKINTGNFMKCKIGKLLGKITSEFKIEIGTHYKDDKRDLVIVDKEYRDRPDNKGSNKYYKYKCNKCGYDDGWVVESSLLNGTGCACCCDYNKTPILGMNTIWDTDKWMCDLGVSEEDAKKYTKSSGKSINIICPDCGNKKKMLISHIYQNKSISCNKCGDSIPYPEKVVFNILTQLNIDFQSQLTKTTFDWCKDYRYDFYFELNNERYIIETHGSQHPNTKYYNDGISKMSGKTYEQELQNDITKKNLAIKNRIKEENYIVIDCSLSTIDFIKTETRNSSLNDLFNLSNINWNEVENFALSTRIKEACKIKRDNPKITTSEIGAIMKISKPTAREYLVKGSKIWDWINYDPKEEIKNSVDKARKHQCKQVEVLRDNISLGIFESCAELERQSKDLFGVRLDNKKISLVALGKRNHHKGFTFKYV